MSEPGSEVAVPNASSHHGFTMCDICGRVKHKSKLGTLFLVSPNGNEARFACQECKQRRLEDDYSEWKRERTESAGATSLGDST